MEALDYSVAGCCDMAALRLYTAQGHGPRELHHLPIQCPDKGAGSDDGVYGR